MSKTGTQTLDDRLYAILTEHLGERWDPFWMRIRKSFSDEEAPIARALKNRLWRIVVTSVFVEVKAGKSEYFDKSLKELWEAPLEFGQIFVNPISGKICMVGYDPPVTSMSFLPARTALANEPRPSVIGFQGSEARAGKRYERLRQITPAAFFCRGLDGKWYEVSYEALPKPYQFEGGSENLGHIDYLKTAVFNDSKFGYTKTLLTPEKVREYNLPMAS